MKPNAKTTEQPIPQAVLIGIINKQQSESLAFEYLDELAFLAQTYGVETKKVFTQKLERPDLSLIHI